MVAAPGRDYASNLNRFFFSFFRASLKHRFDYLNKSHLRFFARSFLVSKYIWRSSNSDRHFETSTPANFRLR